MKRAWAAFFLAGSVFALNQDAPVKQRSPQPQAAAPVSDEVSVAIDRDPARVPGDSDLADALNLVKRGQYNEATVRLFQLSFSPRFLDRRMQIKFMLGLTLQKINFPQLAAFQFMSVVKDGNNHYATQALEHLSQVADRLNDDSLLNYAYSKIKIDSFPSGQRDRLFLRIGEFERRHGQFQQAATTFSHVNSGNPYYALAKYQEGLSYAEGGKPSESVAAFDELIESRRAAAANDPVRAEALMGKARSLYQKKDWDRAIEAYREIPRDTAPWHDTLFEASWAMLRSGRFRSALSNFHSLHSAFYENTYLPESLILRSIVYIYICKYAETEKVLNLFNRMYKPAYDTLDQMLRENRKPENYFSSLQKILGDFRRDSELAMKRHYDMPFVVAQKISREADFQGAYRYVNGLAAEKLRMERMPAAWRASSLGQYSRKVIETRLQKAKQHAGRQVHAHLVAIHNELLDLLEQEGFIRYEVINGRKEELKKKISGRELPNTQIDEANERAYYVQNGYEYWPFRGEYWLDELGNYHYVGTQSCH